MPGRARPMIRMLVARMLAAGLMLLAVLVLSAAPVPLGESGHAHQVHGQAAHQHPVNDHPHHPSVASLAGEPAGAPHSDHCDHHGPVLACCVAGCPVAPAAVLADPYGATPSAGIMVVYRAASASDPAEVVPNPALRPPEPVG